MSDGNWFHAAGADTAQDRRRKFVDVETTMRSCHVCVCMCRLVSRLISAGANVCLADKSHLLPVHLAAARGHSQVFQLVSQCLI